MSGKDEGNNQDLDEEKNIPGREDQHYKGIFSIQTGLAHVNTE